MLKTFWRILSIAGSLDLVCSLHIGQWTFSQSFDRLGTMFLTKQFLTKFFLTKNFLWLNIFLDPKFFWAENFWNAFDLSLISLSLYANFQIFSSILFGRFWWVFFFLLSNSKLRPRTGLGVDFTFPNNKNNNNKKNNSHLIFHRREGTRGLKFGTQTYLTIISSGNQNKY